MTNTSIVSPYSLTIDGYPLGVFAAIEVFGQIKMLLNITFNGEPVPCLTERTNSAIETACQHMGTESEKISIVCFDDGGDGSELEHLKNVFRCTIKTHFVNAPTTIRSLLPIPADEYSLSSANRVRFSALTT